jgi:uncharacterized phage protein (TIGR01671 family)
MDEIKYKAWDKSLKEMRNDFLGKSGDGKADWILFFEPGTTDGGKRIDGINNPYPRERFILLQFTGLYDKNKTPEHPLGVPIYEGDIIQSGDHKELKLIGHRGYVIFEDGAFTLERRKHKVPYNYDKYIPYLDWPSEAFELCKVIGNIYENPELLKEE